MTAVSFFAGDPSTMNKLNVYADLIRDVADEMARMVDEALAAGIHKWNISTWR
jgi:dihydropteroate synthase